MGRRFLLMFFLFFSGSVFAEPFPIDIVYTWVDGSDPRWQKEYQHWSERCGENFLQKATGAYRYRSRDEIKYSLRSVLQYAYFVNHIYIVTFGQTPHWLVPHPKITIVDHDEIFLKKSDLPTFNSQAIEAHLHRIPNLSEHYLYLNDDVLFTKKVVPGDFFDKDGKIGTIFSGSRAPSGVVAPMDKAFSAAWKNTNRLLDTIFVPEKRKCIAHGAYAMKKSLVRSLESAFPEIFALVSSHKFRAQDDYVITNGLIQYWALYTQRATVSSLKACTLKISGKLSCKLFSRMNKVREGRFHMICLQDGVEQMHPLEERVVQDFFNEMYPDPAPWEKDLPL